MGDCDINCDGIDCVDCGVCFECGFEVCFRCGSACCEVGGECCTDVCAPALGDGLHVCGQALGDGCTAIGGCCSSCGETGAHAASAAAQGISSGASSAGSCACACDCCGGGAGGNCLGNCHLCVDVTSSCWDIFCRPGYWFIDFGPGTGATCDCNGCCDRWSKKEKRRCRNITLFILFALFLALVVSGSVYVARQKGIEGKPLLGVGLAAGVVFILLSSCILYACCERRLEQGPSPAALKAMPNWAKPQALRSASTSQWLAYLPRDHNKMSALEADLLRRHSAKDASVTDGAPPIDWSTGEAAVEIRRAADGSVYREASHKLAVASIAPNGFNVGASPNGFSKDAHLHSYPNPNPGSSSGAAAASLNVAPLVQPQVTAPPLTAFSEGMAVGAGAAAGSSTGTTPTSEAASVTHGGAGSTLTRADFDFDDHDRDHERLPGELADVPSARSIYMLGENQAAWTTQLERLRLAINKKDALICIRRATATAVDPVREVPAWVLDAFRQTAEAKRNGPDGHKIWTTPVKVAFGDLLRLLIARISAAEAQRALVSTGPADGLHGHGADAYGSGGGGGFGGGYVTSADAVTLHVQQHGGAGGRHGVLGATAPPPPPPPVPVAMRAALGVPRPPGGPPPMAPPQQPAPMTPSHDRASQVARARRSVGSAPNSRDNGPVGFAPNDNYQSSLNL